MNTLCDCTTHVEWSLRHDLEREREVCELGTQNSECFVEEGRIHS